MMHVAAFDGSSVYNSNKIEQWCSILKNLFLKFLLDYKITG